MKNLLLCLCLLPLAAVCQSLPLSPEYEKALSRQTRTTTGKPGEKYWQNHSDYTIKASLEPTTRLLKGSESVIYYNDSPDNLDKLVIRLYPDIFKKGFKTDGSQSISPEDINETGVNIEKILVNGKKITKYERKGTNLFLPVSLKSKTDLKLEIDWNYKIPAKTHIREGTYEVTSSFVAYWYPQIAVYDDVDGWDVLDYTGQQEFYNDFSNFDVEITMPAKHQVWATGNWQNAEQVLAPPYLELYKKAIVSDSVIHIFTKEDRKSGDKLTLDKPNHTWKYKAENIPDFAFAASDTYLWDLTSVVVDDKTGRRTATGAIFPKGAADFYKVAGYARQCVDYFSHKLPGIPFPYPSLTVFNGGFGQEGMEFPGMVNDGSDTDEFAIEVTAHEIAHTYFPFYMGINERKFAWMDEGWAQTLPNDMEFNLNGETFKPQQTNALIFVMLAGERSQVPLMTPSYKITGNPYANASYFQPSQAYTILKNMFGEEEFKRILQEYMSRWHGKHPQPWDFFNSFSEASGQNLDWFWKPWFFESQSADLSLKVTPEGEKATVAVSKEGGLPVPVLLRITYKDGTKETIRQPVSVWQKGEKEFKLVLEKTPARIDLGDIQIPDTKPRNNVYEAKK
jgi:hypothetical protein